MRFKLNFPATASRKREVEIRRYRQACLESHYNRSTGKMVECPACSAERMSEHLSQLRAGMLASDAFTGL